MFAVLVSVHSWRLFCTDCCPLGAHWLLVVRSREVSAVTRIWYPHAPGTTSPVNRGLKSLPREQIITVI